MTPKSVKNIVLSCENQAPYSLISNVDEILTEKVTKAYNKKKRELNSKVLTEGKKLLLEPEKDKDPYESYEPKVREAIDYTVESVLENNLELENTIQMAAKQYGIKEESLREYFNTFLGETTRTEIRVDSTKSNDQDSQSGKGLRDDEDTNKRVRYESVLVLKDGHRMVLNESIIKKIDTVMENLTEDNLKYFVDLLTGDKTHFLKAVDFCQRMIND